VLSMTVASDLCRSAGAPLKNTPDFGGPISKKNHGHAALPKSYQCYQIDELRSQTLQSHVPYTYLPSALEIAN